MNRPQSEQSIQRLIKLAGERDQPSSAGMERARRAAQESWGRMLDRRQAAPRRGVFKLLAGLAVAAGLATIAIFMWTQPRTAAPAELVAHIIALDGGATLREAGVDAVARIELPVHSDATLATSKGRVALNFGNALSLRLDNHTRLRFDGREQVTLLEGAIYVDSGGLAALPNLSIETPAGTVRHVGTQFEVSVTNDSTRVRVREGRVLLLAAEAGAPADIGTGDELRVIGHERQWQHGLPSFGENWEWATTVAPPLDIENRPLAEFLAWMIREHGWQLRYGDESLQQRTHEIRLHGSLDRLDAAAMLERLSLVTGVPMHEHDGVLWVGQAR